MELLWIYLLIFNGYVANAFKPECCKEECCRDCAVFNVPFILCAPDMSKVTVTPYCEYANIPQFKNLLSKDCSTNLCDLLCQGEPIKIECCKPKICKPDDPPENTILSQPADPAISNVVIDLDEPALIPDPELPQAKGDPEVPQTDPEAPLKPDGTEENAALENPLLKEFLIYPPPPIKPPPHNPPTKPPPNKPPTKPPLCEPPTKPPQCEPPKKPPPCEPPTKPPPCCEPLKPPCVPLHVPTSSCFCPDFGCGYYPRLCVNPRYLCELSSLYGSPNNAHVVSCNQNYFNPSTQCDFGQMSSPVPNGQPQFFYKNPEDKILTTVPSKNEPPVCFDRDCYSKFCRSYHLPPKAEPIPNYICDKKPCNTYPNYDQQPYKAQPPTYSAVDILYNDKKVEPPPAVVPESPPPDIQPKQFDIDFTGSDYTGPEFMSSPETTDKTDKPNQTVINVNNGEGQQNVATEMQYVESNSVGGGGGGVYSGDKGDIRAGNSQPSL